MMGAALNASHRTAPDEVTTRASAAPPLLLVVSTLVHFMCISLHEGDKGRGWASGEDLSIPRAARTRGRVRQGRPLSPRLAIGGIGDDGRGSKRVSSDSTGRSDN